MGIDVLIALGGLFVLAVIGNTLKRKKAYRGNMKRRSSRAGPRALDPYRNGRTDGVDAVSAAYERRLQQSPAEKTSRQYSYIARKPLHPIEQDLYWKLRLAVPSYSVLPQVAMSQIVEPVPNIYEAWNPIAQKVVDFLVLKRDFSPLCVIELDGRHHQDQKQRAKDEKRDAALTMAGIPVIRWTMRTIPSGDDIASLIRGLDVTQSPNKSIHN